MRDALSLFDQVLAFTGDEVKDEDVAGLLGLVDRELLHRASRAIVDGSSLAMLELVESLADYGADYRNFVRELLLHLRELLLVKLAPAESPLLAQILPEELERAASARRGALGGGPAARARRADGGRDRAAPGHRPARDVDLVLLKLVQMRRLVPFAELVARVERLAGGALPAPAPQQATAQRSLLESARGAAPAVAQRPVFNAPRPAAASPATPPQREARRRARHPRRRRRRARRLPRRGDDRPVPGSPVARGSAARPPPRACRATRWCSSCRPTSSRSRGPHARRLPGARAQGGRPRARSCGFEAGAVAPVVETPAPEAERRQKLREEAEKEPAVQEALDLFDGRGGGRAGG